MVERSGGGYGVSELRDVLQAHQRTGRPEVVPDISRQTLVFWLGLDFELISLRHLKHCVLGVL